MNAWDRFALTPRHDSLDVIRDADAEIRKKHEVLPLAESPAQREKTLFDLYARENEIAAVRAAHARIATAQDAVTKVRAALITVSEQIFVAERGVHLDADRAAAVALGEVAGFTPRPRQNAHLYLNFRRSAPAYDADLNKPRKTFRTARVNSGLQCLTWSASAPSAAPRTTTRPPENRRGVISNSPWRRD